MAKKTSAQDIMEALRTILSEYRKDKRYSLSEFSAKCGLGKDYLYKFEKGEANNLSIEAIFKILDGCETSVNKLLRAVPSETT